MNTVYQLVIAYGEWDSYSEEVVFVDSDYDRVFAVRDELKRRATDALIRRQTLGMVMCDADDVYGWLAFHMEDGLSVRLEAVKVGVLGRERSNAEVLSQEEWYMPQFKNMEDQPWEGDDLELHRYEQLAEPWEQRFLG